MTISSPDGSGVAAFDTDPDGRNASGPDPDLIVDSGIALIIQSDNRNAGDQTGGIFGTPNDKAGGGTISLLFSGAVTVLSVDVIDINGNGPADLILTDGAGRTRTYGLPFEFTGDPSEGAPGIATFDLTLLGSQVGVGPGNPS